MHATTSPKRRHHRASEIAAALILLTSVTSPAQETRSPTPQFSPTSVSAGGSDQSLLSVSRYGRYRIAIESAASTTFELIDRMAGSRARSRPSGRSSGRVDAFLDAGEYLLRTSGPKLASGTAELTVRRSRETVLGAPRQLLPERTVTLELGDGEHASHWIQVDETATVLIEAAGRNLADVAIWRDGSWLVDATPTLDLIQPIVGQELGHATLAVELEPGLYRIACYGGPTLPWAEDSDRHPLYLRMGLPTHAVAGRRRHEMSPFGIDRYLVPGKASYFRLELERAAHSSLVVSKYDSVNAFTKMSAAATIDHKSVPPVAEVSVGSHSGFHVVTVRAGAGTAYVLHHFRAETRFPIDNSGRRWVSTIHSGHAGDCIDASAVITATPKKTGGRRHARVEAARAIEVGAGEPWWRRRFNLLAPATLFLQVEKPGRYEVLFRERHASVRIEPLLLNWPDAYEAPAFELGTSVWDLDPGLHLLTLNPTDKGIVDVVVRPASRLRFLWDAMGYADEESPGELRASARFGPLTLDPNNDYELHVGKQPGVKVGLLSRALPIDLRDSLPVALRGGEELELEIVLRDTAQLTATSDDGTRLEVALYERAFASEIESEPGVHTLRVRNPTQRTQLADLTAVATRLLDTSPLPHIPEAGLAQLPNYAVLTSAAPVHLDLGRKSSATLLVKATEPGLFRLETTGLLATTATLRTRTVPSLVTVSENGVGRNALIQQYLRAGDYQLTVGTNGRSRGHLGVSLVSTPVVEGGELRHGVPARATLSPGRAIAYRFSVTADGRYRLESFGVRHAVYGRLEDSDGWPIGATNSTVGGIAELTAGDYRLIVLPRKIDARVVTKFSIITNPVSYKGHGPHLLPLDQTIRHRWHEPENDAALRTPDSWNVSLPATVEAKITLTDDMHGYLIPEDGQTTESIYIPPRRGFTGPLVKGRYRLEVTSLRPNNLLDYQIRLSPTELVAGLSRSLIAPASIPLQVGESSIVELSSFGRGDIRATLRTADGRLLARNDDRRNDWNFLLAQRLKPGSYTLELAPVGSPSASTVISMRSIEEVVGSEAQLPLKRRFQPGSQVHVLPISAPAPGSLLIAQAHSPESIAMVLEEYVDGAWRSLGIDLGASLRIEVPTSSAEAPRPLRLHLWSVDRGNQELAFSVTSASPGMISERKLRRGASPVAIPGTDPVLETVRVTLNGAGALMLDDVTGDMRFTSRPGEATRSGRSGMILATTRELWLVRERREKSPPLRAERITLDESRESGLWLALDHGAPVAINVSRRDSGPMVVLATSSAGQPCVRLDEPSSLPAAPGSIAGLAVSDGRSVAVSLRQRSRLATVWRADDITAPSDVRITSIALSSAPSARVSRGMTEGSIESGQALELALPTGRKRLDLTLEHGLVATLSTGGKIERTIWASDRPLDEEIETTAATLTLLNPGVSRHYRLELIPVGDAVDNGDLAVTGVRGFERFFGRAGDVTIRIDRKQVSPGTLRIRGPIRKATYIGEDGRILTSQDIEIEADGLLHIHHGQGTVVVWLDDAGTATGGPWNSTPDDEPELVAPPALVALRGVDRRMRLELERPAALRVTTREPVAIRLERYGVEPEITLHPEGAALDAYLPTGTTTLTLRALAGGELHDEARVTTTEVDPIGEGLGPIRLIPPGVTTFFSLQVTRAGEIGIGVRASADTVETRLLDEHGQTIGIGAVQMPTLEPGRYVLGLTAPANGPPLRARAAIAGLTRPGTEPPEHVIQQYLGRTDSISIMEEVCE